MRNNIKMPKQVRHDNMQGRSMVEMLGVLAIIGVLSAGGLAGYSKAMFKHKLNSTMDQITMLVTNIRTIYGTQRTYNGLTNAQAFKLGIIPPAIATAEAGPYRNPFKGSVDITTSTTKASGSPADSAFVVTYGGLPKEACIALATADFGSGAGSGFIGVAAFASPSTPGANNTSTPNTAATLVYVGTGSTTGNRAEGDAYDMAGALGACTSESNTVSWKFY
ncbi:MAG: hypothetical protein IKR60_00005 [Alphaproteobacteria bacterium]|nr:hypothetical protein [Alphaproteobacteria bacterium]